VLQDAAEYGKLLPSIFSHNLIRCLINQLQQKDRFLNRAADKSLKVLVHSAEANPKIILLVLPRIIGGYGTYNFDKVTKTKTIEKLLSLVDDENAPAVIDELVQPCMSISNAGSEVVKEAEMRRQLLGDYLLNMVPKVLDESRDTSWVEKHVLTILANFAYTNTSTFQPGMYNESPGSATLLGTTPLPLEAR